MKTIYDFVFCESKITQDTIVYSVLVGTSKRDQRALRYVRRRLKPGTFILAPHSTQFIQWAAAMEAQLFKPITEPRTHCGHFLRRLMVHVSFIASFLRKNPAPLLNSMRINTPWFWLLLRGNSK